MLASPCSDLPLAEELTNVVYKRPYGGERDVIDAVSAEHGDEGL
jgi:hypothetical protein